MNSKKNDWINNILQFWFEDLDNPSLENPKWWQKNDDFDNIIKEKYAKIRQQAASGCFDHWATTPTGRLALIIVLDQFSRNIYRNHASAFACDNKALQLSKEGLTLQHDQQLLPIERAFFYMPFQHSEQLAMQMLSIKLFAKLYNDASASDKKIFANYLNYANQHADIIKRFGRFPHRNTLLKRQSTLKEQQFLKQPGSSF